MTELSAELTTALARLRVLAGPSRGQVFDLSTERISIGREGDNVICLHDINISQHHALLIWHDTSYKLRDLISTNGTYVNGQRTAAAVLRDGDIVCMGEVEMRYDAIPLPARPVKPQGVRPVEVPARDSVVALGASKVEKAERRIALPFGKPRSAAAPSSAEPVTQAEYRIVGSDGRTYGPVGVEQMRHWISMGYANAQTWVPAEERRDWKQVSEFSEFAEALAATPSTGTSIGVPPEEALFGKPVKVVSGKTTVPELVVGRTDLAKTRPRRGRSVWSLLSWAVVVLCLVLVGAAYQRDWWPFSTQGPLKDYRRNAGNRIYSDPDYQAAASAEESKNYPELLKNAQVLTGRYPESSLAFYITGVAYGKLGFVDEAVTAFRQAIKLKPDYIDAWNNLGWAYTLQGKFSDAIAAFQQAVDLSPTDPQAWSNLGRALTGQGRYAEAVTAYQKAIGINPNYAEAHYNLGVALADEGQYIDALEALDKAIKLKPDFTEAWFNLGVVSQKQGQNSEAVVFYQQAIKLKPDYADAWGGLVKAHMGLKQFKEASDAAKEMKRIDPEKANTLADELRAAAP